MGRRLYVGNLSYATTELELRELFGEIGPVTEVKVVMERDTGRPRGFGFVEMGNERAARAAVEKLNGREFGGRGINVSEAQERSLPGGRSGGGRNAGRSRW